MTYTISEQDCGQYIMAEFTPDPTDFVPDPKVVVASIGPVEKRPPEVCLHILESLE